MRSVPCPGYFERDDQEIIELQGVEFCHYYCALCGQKAIPIKKENGRWIVLDEGTGMNPVELGVPREVW